MSEGADMPEWASNSFRDSLRKSPRRLTLAADQQEHEQEQEQEQEQEEAELDLFFSGEESSSEHAENASELRFLPPQQNASPPSSPRTNFGGHRSISGRTKGTRAGVDGLFQLPDTDSRHSAPTSSITEIPVLPPKRQHQPRKFVTALHYSQNAGIPSQESVQQLRLAVIMQRRSFISEKQAEDSRERESGAMGFLEYLDPDNDDISMDSSTGSTIQQSRTSSKKNRRKASPRRYALVPLNIDAIEKSLAQWDKLSALSSFAGSSITCQIVDVRDSISRYYTLQVYPISDDAQFCYQVERPYKSFYQLQSTLSAQFGDQWTLPKKPASGQELMILTDFLNTCCRDSRYFCSLPFIKFINPKTSLPLQFVLSRSDISGWVEFRRSGLAQRSRKRFAVLYRERIYFYKNDSKSQLEPDICHTLEFSRYSLRDDDDHFCVQFDNIFDKQVLSLRVEDMQQAHQWFNAICDAAGTRSLRKYHPVEEQNARSPVVDLPLERSSLTPISMEPTMDIDYYVDDLIGTNIVFNEKGDLRGASASKLVEKMLDDKVTQHNSILTFLLTFGSYLEPSLLLDQIMSYYYKPPGSGDDVFVSEKGPLSPPQIRTCSLLQKWIETKPLDFQSDANLSALLLGFVESLKREGLKRKLFGVIDRRLFGKEPKMKMKVPPVSPRSKEAGASQPRKSPRTPRSPRPKRPVPEITSTCADLFAHTPVQIAHQMTLLDFKLFRAVRFSEFDNQAWTGKDKYERAPRLMAAIDSFNRVSRMIASTILAVRCLKTRGQLVTWWIDVGSECQKLKNFNGVMAVTAAFGRSAISRLRKTWATLKSTAVAKLAALRKLVGTTKNFKQLRESLQETDPPLVPYVGVFLSDLTFVDQGNSVYLKMDDSDQQKSRCINWEKCLLQGAIVKQIHLYQLKGYSDLKSVPVIQQVLWGSKFESEEDQYAKSLSLEPRKPKKKTK